MERAFEVLQPHWRIVREAAMMGESEILWQLMICCVILHNVIAEYEGDDVAPQTNDFEALRTSSYPEKSRCSSAYELSTDASESSRSAGAHTATQ